MKIAILGAGAFGTALGGILADKGHDVDFYDAKLEREKLAEVVDGAKVIVLAVPSSVAPHLLPYLPTNVPLIIASKGFLDAHYFDDFKDYMVLSGPGYADEIKARKKTKLTATDSRIVDLFGTDYLEFELTDDKKGVLLCGALKNTYAILAGILNLQPDGVSYHKFLNDAAFEMEEILVANGAKRETVDLSCGKGDLKITCFYPSRNYEFGQMLRKDPGYVAEKTVEGVSALKKIKRGDIVLPDNVPLLKDLLNRSEKWA